VAPVPSPALGQHNDDVLHHLLGLSAAQIEALRQDRII
jgi:crotonobetainyl-CoA:carnitine CoA-transferase CaiB-like acyl-CoA transferase